MKDDERMAALLTECIAELDTHRAGRSARIRDLLGQIEAISPGEVEAMANRLQLRRLGLTTAH